MHKIPSVPDLRAGYLTVELRLDRRWMLRSIDLAPDTQISLMERSPYFFLVTHGERVHFAPDQQVHFGAYRLAAQDFGQLPAGPLVVVNRSPDHAARVFLLSDRVGSRRAPPGADHRGGVWGPFEGPHDNRQAGQAPAVHARAHSLAATPSEPPSGQTRWWQLLVQTDLCHRGWDVGVDLHRVVGATRRPAGPTRAMAVILEGHGRLGRAGNDNGAGETPQPVQAGDVLRLGRDVPHVIDAAEGGLSLLTLRPPGTGDDVTPGPDRGPRSIMTSW